MTGHAKLRFGQEYDWDHDAGGSLLTTIPTLLLCYINRDVSKEAWYHLRVQNRVQVEKNRIKFEAIKCMYSIDCQC
jgi:hypothetical protein